VASGVRLPAGVAGPAAQSTPGWANRASDDGEGPYWPSSSQRWSSQMAVGGVPARPSRRHVPPLSADGVPLVGRCVGPSASCSRPSASSASSPASGPSGLQLSPPGSAAYSAQPRSASSSSSMRPGRSSTRRRDPPRRAPASSGHNGSPARLTTLPPIQSTWPPVCARIAGHASGPCGDPSSGRYGIAMTGHSLLHSLRISYRLGCRAHGIPALRAAMRTSWP
jgi:hypothetical protein